MRIFGSLVTLLSSSHYPGRSPDTMHPLYMRHQNVKLVLAADQTVWLTIRSWSGVTGNSDRRWIVDRLADISGYSLEVRLILINL
jgi:hypothetical protein